MIIAQKKDLLKWDFFKNINILAESFSQPDSRLLQDRSDEDLISCYKAGDLNAFRVLLSRHQKPVFNFLYRFLGNPEVTEEAFQEVFVRVIKAIDEYRPSARFTTWLYTIARNYCIDYRRKARFRQHLSFDDLSQNRDSGDQEMLCCEKPGADVLAGSGELKDYLEQILNDLPAEQREVFLLREMQGLSFHEIAQVTKTSENTVKSRMRYAIAAIQKKFLEMGIIGLEG